MNVQYLLLTDEEQEKAIKKARETYPKQFILGDVRIIHKVILEAQLNKALNHIFNEWGEEDCPHSFAPIQKRYCPHCWLEKKREGKMNREYDKLLLTKEEVLQALHEAILPSDDTYDHARDMVICKAQLKKAIPLVEAEA